MEKLFELALGRRVSVPPHLPPESIPPDVTLRRGSIVPALGGFFSRMGGPAAAVTLRRTIVLRPGVDATAELIAHELAHVRQWRHDPLFPLRYAVATLRHGYENNPYEVEARMFAASASSSPTRKETN